MGDARECERANAPALALIRAAEELMRTADGIRHQGAKGASAYQTELLASQWKYYKSLGGAAASPEQVRLPEDPCKEARQALQQKGAALEAEYRNCVAAHPKEMRLMALSRELASNRRYLAMLEKAHEEKGRNPNFEAESRGGGEWARALKADPALARARLAAQFQEYRSAGGTATRLEEVSEMPNPCAPAAVSAGPPASIGARKSLSLPAQ